MAMISPGQWRNAGRKSKMGKLNGTTLIPLLLAFVGVSVTLYSTLYFAILYVGVELYLLHKGRRMSWMLNNFFFKMRDGVMFARTPRYWRLMRTY